MNNNTMKAISHKFEPLLSNLNLSSGNLLSLVALAIALTAAVVFYQTQLDAKNPERYSLGWYVANPTEAKAQNIQCYEDASIQQTEACLNSLHALEMSHKDINL